MSVSGAVKLRTSGGYQKRVAKVEIGRNTSNWWGTGDVFSSSGGEGAVALGYLSLRMLQTNPRKENHQVLTG